MDIIKLFYESANEENQGPMSAYMKNKFPFLGLKKPERQVLSKDFLRAHKNVDKIDWAFIDKCWQLPEREFQYLAISYLDTVKDFLKQQDMARLEKYIEEISWWDSVDSISPLVGYVGLKYPSVKTDYISKWITEQSIWLKRVSIIHQLKYKEKTDLELLSRSIISNKETGEFFVDKAIGWALREYSKTDKAWVRKFMEDNQLSKLSVREGSKYIYK